MNNKIIIILIAIFWFVSLSSMIVYKQYTIITGEQVLLKTVPIDPRDLFRGDYVILSYEDISTIKVDLEDSKSISSSFNNKYEIDIYIILDKDADTNIASYQGVSTTKPESGLFIKGKASKSYGDKNDSNMYLNINYGIESFFVPEGKGLEIERSLGEIYTNVSIDRNGNAVLRNLYLNDQIIPNLN
jgi:uncharacterized membrane-anchored protein